MCVTLSERSPRAKGLWHGRRDSHRTASALRCMCRFAQNDIHKTFTISSFVSITSA